MSAPLSSSTSLDNYDPKPDHRLDSHSNDECDGNVASPQKLDAATPLDPIADESDIRHLQEHLNHAAASAVDDHPQQHEQSLHDPNWASLYYNASTMASLNPLALAAVSRLRSYKPPAFPLWDTLPSRKRAAVLILLYGDRRGDLRVVITMRAASLRSFSGHAALPGGKADSEKETPYQIARREAWEEIGLPMEDLGVPKPFRIEELCCLPPTLARTHLVVTPCVAFLHTDRQEPGSLSPVVEDSMIPRLDAREVAALFSAPFYNFLKATDLPPEPGQKLPPGHWYEGTWIQWKDVPWRSHNFYVPITNQKVSKPRRSSLQPGGVQEVLEPDQEQEGRFKVWGMTGRILVDAARIAYAETPEIPHNETYGDFDIIMRAHREGEFRDPGEPRKKSTDPEPAKM